MPMASQVFPPMKWMLLHIIAAKVIAHIKMKVTSGSIPTWQKKEHHQASTISEECLIEKVREIPNFLQIFWVRHFATSKSLTTFSIQQTPSHIESSPTSSCQPKKKPAKSGEIFRQANATFWIIGWIACGRNGWSEKIPLPFSCQANNP